MKRFEKPDSSIKVLSTGMALGHHILHARKQIVDCWRRNLFVTVKILVFCSTYVAQTVGPLLKRFSDGKWPRALWRLGPRHGKHGVAPMVQHQWCNTNMDQTPHAYDHYVTIM
jgi:hypothetical protein